MTINITAAKLYFNRKILTIILLGFVSGLPLSLTASTLGIWMAKVGVSKTAIGLFALVGIPYVIKFLWAPFIDHLRLPLLTEILGRRRSWIIFSEILLMISIITLGAFDPTVNPWNTACLALLVAIFSATQDIVIDAYRIEILKPEEQGAGAAAAVFGHRVGMLVSGAGALYLSTYLGWQQTYFIMAFLILIGFAAIFIAGEPATSIDKYGDTKYWLKKAVINPFSEFISREKNWLYILLFIILYKLGDAFAGVMTGPFLIDIGFTEKQIASVVKLYGFFATMLGIFIGGALVKKWGLVRNLWMGGVLQMISNLMFVWQTHAGNDLFVLTLTISIENFTAGVGTAAIVAYISNLCNINYTATQYALFSALAAVGRTMLSSSSGHFADSYGWVNFFLLSTVIAVPALLMLVLISKRNKRLIY